MEEKQEQSVYELSEADQIHEDEVNEITGRADAEGAFSGGSADDSKIRRIARGEYRDSDFGYAEPLAAIDHPFAFKTAADIKTYEDWHSYLDCQDAAGREKYEDWDECLKWAHNYVTKAVGDNEDAKAELRQLLLQPDVGVRAYKLGKRLKSMAPGQSEIDTMPVDEFEDRMREWAKTARGANDQDGNERWVTRSEMKFMNQLAPADFERELDRLKQRGF
jgi:hypothetical protein